MLRALQYRVLLWSSARVMVCSGCDAARLIRPAPPPIILEPLRRMLSRRYVSCACNEIIAWSWP